MSVHHADTFRNKAISKGLTEKINAVSTRNIRLMEVCGTHTMSVFKYGIRSLLPDQLTLVSGPGCPVCVTSQSEIDALIRLAESDDVIIATFGDLLRVPGSGSSLREKQAQDCDIRIVYSSIDAIDIAKNNPDKTVIFPGIGFETTAPGTAAAILSAHQQSLNNFSVFSLHKTVPPALSALMSTPEVNIDGFLLPGHVSVILGTNTFRPFAETSKVPCVIAGFEPVDILMGILRLVEKIESGDYSPENAYTRAVSDAGNAKALSIMNSVFDSSDALWRGIGRIPGSGLTIKPQYQIHDAADRFDISYPDKDPVTGCICGDILTGRKIPTECALFGKNCTPVNPTGPCMVSSEGTCSAYYKYQ